MLVGLMNNIFSNFNSISFHTLVFLATVFVMLLIGMVFLQIKSCQMVDYMYTSGRLEGSQTNFLCKIF
jgi:hypothetical protein